MGKIRQVMFWVGVAVLACLALILVVLLMIIGAGVEILLYMLVYGLVDSSMIMGSIITLGLAIVVLLTYKYDTDSLYQLKCYLVHFIIKGGFILYLAMVLYSREGGSLLLAFICTILIVYSHLISVVKSHIKEKS